MVLTTRTKYVVIDAVHTLDQTMKVRKPPGGCVISAVLAPSMLAIAFSCLLASLPAGQAAMLVSRCLAEHVQPHVLGQHGHDARRLREARGSLSCPARACQCEKPLWLTGSNF